MNHYRNGLLYLLMASAVICLGLLSRRMIVHLPDLLNLVLGDALWALMIYFLFGLVLGFGFLWSDLVGYSLGIGFGSAVFEILSFTVTFAFKTEKVC